MAPKQKSDPADCLTREQQQAADEQARIRSNAFELGVRRLWLLLILQKNTESNEVWLLQVVGSRAVHTAQQLPLCPGR
jgi:hypothetical protein